MGFRGVMAPGALSAGGLQDAQGCFTTPIALDAAEYSFGDVSPRGGA
jgi:hypothetical protein